MSPTLRCFVAIELPPEIHEALLAAGEALRGEAPSWAGEKWVASQNLHITLKFLGGVPEESLATLAAALGAATSRHAPFDLSLDNLRAVPSVRRCSMVWGSFADASGRCAELAEELEREAAVFGVLAESRRFTPHVTLVRARRPRSLPVEALTSANAGVTSGERFMSVRRATLFASTLTRRGPIYEVLEQWELTGG